MKRDYNKDNITKFLNCLAALSFVEIYEETCCNKAFNTFHDLFTLFYKLCFPEILVKKTNKPIKNKWLSKGLKISCIKKRTLYYEYQHNAVSKSYHKKKYHNYTKILKKCISQSQRINNNIFFNNSKNKCKATWSIIKNNLNKPSSSTFINELIFNGKKITNSNDICTQFNNYFIELTQQVQKDNYDTNNIDIDNNINTLFLTPLNPIDVIKIINSLNNTNATGYDEVTTKIIKLSAKIIATPLSYLINLSFEEGVFPYRLKQSIIKPLFKKGNCTDVGNYRPITLIPIFSKIFEKAMHDKINSFVTKFNLIVENQFGFRKNSSTTLACFYLVKQITEALNSKQSTLSIFLDISKAFDFVPHERLLCKLERYGIRGKAHDWLKSYLSNRQQRTVISRIENNTKMTYSSELKVNNFGVPQGSVLGPPLFILFINDLKKCLKCGCTQFADDTTLTIKCSNKNDIEIDANNELINVMKWLSDNNLQVNIEKTKIIQFQTCSWSRIPTAIKYNKAIIQPVPSTLFLGIVIDDKLNWKEHVERVCGKLDRFVYAIRKLRLVSSKQTVLSAYHGYVSSVLRYGLVIWGNSVDIERAFLVQKKTIRAMSGADYLDHCKPLFKKFKILPLPCLYIFEVCLFVRRHPHLFILDEQISERLKKIHAGKLLVPSQRLQLYSRNASCMTIKIYNKLPPALKMLPMNKFKCKMFTWLLDMCFYSVNEFLNHPF